MGVLLIRFIRSVPPAAGGYSFCFRLYPIPKGKKSGNEKIVLHGCSIATIIAIVRFCNGLLFNSLRDEKTA